MAIDTDKAIEIAKGIYWVGFYDKKAGFHCNPYLLIDKTGEAVLFDPGAITYYERLKEKLQSVIDPKKISHIVLHHQDPDLCSSVPQFEKIIGRHVKIAAAWRAGVLIAYYGVTSEFYYVDEHDYGLTLKSGRVLKFIPTPYLHEPGSIVTYDKESGILFSSDLFGGFSFNWSLYADEKYPEAVKAFHEPYMPSNYILRSAMEEIEKNDIKLIAPQHGSIIDKEVSYYINLLKNLECGKMQKTAPDKKSAGDYNLITEALVKRIIGILNINDAKSVLEGTGIVADLKDGRIIEFPADGKGALEKLGVNLNKTGGIFAMIATRLLTQRLAIENNLELPDIFRFS